MNINESMAEVMGWHLGTWLNKNDAWFGDEDGSDIPLFQCYVHTEEKAVRFTTWHPDTDPGQAMRCLVKSGYFTEITIQENRWIVHIPSCTNGESGSGLDKLPLAICEAIKQALEAK